MRKQTQVQRPLLQHYCGQGPIVYNEPEEAIGNTFAILVGRGNAP